MRNTIINELKQRWAQLVAEGNMTAEDMRQSLVDQVNGYLDLAMDEITEEDAERMGWEYGEMTDQQMDEWTEMVNEAASEYLREQMDKLKAKVEPSRCYERLLDTIGECIWRFADNYAEEFGTDTVEMLVALEELVYSKISDREELAERLM